MIRGDEEPEAGGTNEVDKVDVNQETVMVATGTTTTAADGEDATSLSWLSLEVQKAQRLIYRGASEMAEGIVGLSVALLEIRQRRLYRLDPDPACACSFGVFVQQRFQISERLARQYTDALASLGEAHYHALLRDVGAQRTFALALLHKADPALLEAFQMLSASERRDVTATQITTVAKQVVAERGTTQRLEQLERELGRQQGLLQQSRQRLQDVESVHQQTVQTLIEERDTARRSSDQQQQEIQRLRERLRTAPPASPAPVSIPVSIPPSVSPSVSPVPPAAARTRGEAAAERPVVTVITTFDVGTLVIDVQALMAKLEQFSHAHAELTDVPIEQRRELARNLQRLGQVISDLVSR